MSTTAAVSKLSPLKEWMDSYFMISERGSSFLTEFRAGTASFLTMSYLLLVNPQIMASCGVPAGDAVFATATSSAVSSMIVGLVGNLPFGLAPGLGLSAYLAYGLVLTGLTDLKEATTACLVSGMLLFVCALVGVTDVAMWIVPRSVKLAIVVGMGILIAMIGMVSVKMIVGNPDTLVTLGDPSSSSIQICLGGLILIGTLVHHEVTGGILIGIASLTILIWTLNESFPKEIVNVPHIESSWENFVDLECLFRADRATVIYPAVGAFLFISIFDISGVMFGLSTLAELIEDDGTLERSIWTFMGASCGTVVASLTGSTPIILTVESASGIKEGGRTGLTAVIVGLYFFASIFFAPLFGSVPPEATAPVLILVGAMMMGESKKIEWESMSDAVPAFLTIVMMPLTYSITNGMVFGLLAALAFYFTTGAFWKSVWQLFPWRRLRDGESFDDVRTENEGLRTENDKETDALFDGSPVVGSSLMLSKADRALIADLEDFVRNNKNRATTENEPALLPTDDDGGYGSIRPRSLSR